ncbi:hypothetical protein TTHERM_00016450 (macronuclear) [Tetrahymena thermophila SB210]|uniref:Uncharacterized protein n=1 Tax=Tetrahymena thermophila (strain SB210) TaxID=312017 RepID=Q22RE3_TETTS|nr:hypothetical protein TTHERM_00016450 [Tetrahymena thermophila SB210]EAR88179.2 hypothetical protein TTHERM_00016450 [Tetrahymena thermophila SB210]|eukprot:XP_001008424.2 hypothetical protein TTHERM_00016450 [Tetrahymena thermophila SB210]
MGKQRAKAIKFDKEKEKQNQNDVEERDEKNQLVSQNKKIRKAKWKYICSIYPTIQQIQSFYLYGSLILHTNYDPDTVFSNQAIDLVLRHQQIQSVIIDKQIGAIETNFNIINPGLVDFSFLVEHYKNKQLQIYFDFAKSLKDFQIFVNVINQKTIDKQNELKSKPTLLDVFDKQYLEFEKWAQNLIEKHFKDEFFGYSLYQANYRKGYVEMKKQVNSQNSISLFGESMNDVYEAEICKMKNKSVMFEKYQDFNIDLILECLAFEISANASSLPYQKKYLYFSTIEGFQLPGTLEIYKIKFYDYKKNDPNFYFIQEFDYSMTINVLKVDNLWLKRLINIRKELENYQIPNNPPFIFENSSEFSSHNNILNFNEEDSDILSTVKNNNFMQSEKFDQMIDTSQNGQQYIIGSLQASNFLGKNDNKLANADTDLYFTPEVIDLAGDIDRQEYLNKQVLQLQQKEKIVQNLNQFYSYKKQELELSNIEYSCQVEYFLDKYYSDHDSSKNS